MAISRQCFFHPSSSAVAQCVYCGMPICQHCSLDIGGGRIACRERRPGEPAAVAPRRQQAFVNPGPSYVAPQALPPDAGLQGATTDPTPAEYFNPPVASSAGIDRVYDALMAAPPEKRFIYGIGAAVVAALVSVFIWEKISFYTGALLAFSSVGVGFAIAYALVGISGDRSLRASLTGVAITAISMFLGYVLLPSHIIAYRRGLADMWGNVLGVQLFTHVVPDTVSL